MEGEARRGGITLNPLRPSLPIWSAHLSAQSSTVALSKAIPLATLHPFSLQESPA